MDVGFNADYGPRRCGPDGLEISSVYGVDRVMPGVLEGGANGEVLSGSNEEGLRFCGLHNPCDTFFSRSPPDIDIITLTATTTSYRVSAYIHPSLFR